MVVAVIPGRLQEPVKRFVVVHGDQDGCWIVAADRGGQTIHGVAECPDEHTARVVLRALEARQVGRQLLEGMGRQRERRSGRTVMTNALADAVIRRVETGQLALVAIAETTHIPDVARWLREDLGLDPTHAAIAVFKTEEQP